MAGTISLSDGNSSQNLQTAQSEFNSDIQNPVKNSTFHSSIFEQSERKQNSRLSEKYLSAPQKQNITLESVYLEDEDEDQQWSYSVLILPFLHIFHWSLLIPNGIKYDEVRGRFFAEKSGPLIKILSYAWLLCLGVYLAFFMLYDLDEPYTVKVITGKVAWGCYTLFDITAITCLRTNGDRLAKLLTDGNTICHLQHQLMNTEYSKKRCGCTWRKYSVWLVSGITLIYAVFFMTFVMTELTASTTNFYNVYLDLTSRANYSRSSDAVENDIYIDLYYPCNSNKQVLCNLIARFTANVYASILLILWFFMAFTVELIWITFLLLTAACGSYFKRMFTDCSHLIENGQLDLLQGIQVYTKISLLLDDFNEIFGYTLLWIVIASILYQAITLGGFLAGYTTGIMFDVVNVLGFIPFIATVYNASELHRMGHKLPSLIKKQFLNMDIVVRDYKQTLHMIQGTNVVQFDSLSNSLGLKGAGFFTISYAFVGSMIGIVITYSLVTVQFKLNEIPLS